MLATAVMTLVTIGILYFAREILVPIAIAVLLSFVLSPLVKLLRRLHLGKKTAVGVVVLVTFLIAVGIGAVLAKQISDLATDAPKYQATVSRKISGLRDFAAHNPLLSRLESAMADMQKPAPAAKDEPKPAAFPPKPADAAKDAKTPVPVQIVEPPPGVLSILQATAGTAASPLAAAAFVAIFIVFILIQREDLRNRFIRLAGSRDLQRTTIAMNDAARRLSRYFLAQVLLNTGFGLVVAVALAIIGVPSAILWGIVAALMRFIPYIGSVGAALFPVLMAAAVGDGWNLAIETAALFAALEFLVGQVVEPLVYGHNTGISPIAVVLSATFWTWLWGPVGLVLAMPLTVCLVVMGRHIDRLKFLDVLLGDAPPLTEAESFYQRMLAGDPSEVVDHADGYMADHSLLEYCDQIAMKALLMAQIDARRGALDEKHQLRIRDTMRDLAEDLADRDPVIEIDAEKAPASLDEHDASRDPDADLPKVEIAREWRRPGAVTCFAGRTPLDEAAAHLLADLLTEKGIGARVEPAESLTRDPDPERRSSEEAPLLVLLSFLDADLSIAQARFAARRLRRRLTDTPLVAAFWMGEEDKDRASGLCHDVRCDICVSSLPEAIRLCLERAGERRVADAA